MNLSRRSVDNASWRLRALVERLGPVGGVGVALLFGCAVFYVTAVAPAQDDLTSLQEQRVAEDLARRSGHPVVDTASQLRRADAAREQTVKQLSRVAHYLVRLGEYSMARHHHLRARGVHANLCTDKRRPRSRAEASA